MKRKLFIASSKEGHKIANEVQKKIEKQLGDWIEPILWSDDNFFDLNSSTLHTLVKKSRIYDYGIFIGSADDVTIKRNKNEVSMRDNVLLESGLFLGSLGLDRAFLFLHESVKVPTDFLGITISFYNDDEIPNSIDKIIQKINCTKDSYILKISPSAALAVSYYENFIKNAASKHLKNKDSKLTILIPQNIEDIDGVVDRYKSEHSSKFTEGERPQLFYNLDNNYWDIPTILKTIKSVSLLVVERRDIGQNKEYDDFIESEISNFKEVLKFFLSKDTYKDKIFVEQI
ncbi:nucleotide-binding protein [Gammaproteobacteria bacterium]|nr:nucleotide-binding protein [Gammaproteobacteria bacterium]